MNKNSKTSYCISDKDLKVLRKSIEYVKKLDFFGNNKKQQNKIKKLKKVA